MNVGCLEEKNPSRTIVLLTSISHINNTVFFLSTTFVKLDFLYLSYYLQI